MWSMAPAQNFPWNFLAPNCLKSSIVNGHKWRTLLRENVGLFSMTRTSHPSRRQSTASRRPTGPPPTERGREEGREGGRREGEGERERGSEGGRE